MLVDLSNLCRDQSLIRRPIDADLDLLDRFVTALENSEVEFGQVHCVADRSLRPLLGRSAAPRLRAMEQDGLLEYSAFADERLLAWAFGDPDSNSTMVASMDNFDDFRRTFNGIQGATDRFLGWRAQGDTLHVFVRNMGVHLHDRLSRKEESEELKARRLRRHSVAKRAAGSFFRCENSSCLVAQLWSDHIRELPRFDEATERFVCTSCGSSLSAGPARPEATQLIIFLHGNEQFRVLLDEGDELEIGRQDKDGCIGLEQRIGIEESAAVSRRHVRFSRTGGQVKVHDVGSRNGTVLRRTDEPAVEEILRPGASQPIGRRHTVALPSGISIEISGRTFPLDGERAIDGADANLDDRATRILSSRRQ